MAQNIDLEALALEHLQSEHFANYLADAISTLYRDKLMDEFNNEVNKAIEVKVKEVVDEYITTFGEEQIHGLVARALQGITKKELLERL